MGGTWGSPCHRMFPTRRSMLSVRMAFSTAIPDSSGIVHRHSRRWSIGVRDDVDHLESLRCDYGATVTDEEEVEGLDLSQHSETAYSLGGSSLRERNIRLVGAESASIRPDCPHASAASGGGLEPLRHLPRFRDFQACTATGAMDSTMIQP